MSSSRTQPSGLVGRVLPNQHHGDDTDKEAFEDPYNSSKNDKATSMISVDSTASSNSDGAQEGVKQVEAVTSVWTVRSLILAYVAIFLVFYVNSLQQQINGNLTVYVLSDFSEAPLVSTTSIMSSVIGGVARLPTAKIIDVWGRVEGYVLMVLLMTVGIIMMAACDNVETYAAAQVFYWVGYDGILYVLDVVIADTSSLKNRPWLFAFTNCPYIANTFAGPAAAQAFYTGSTWRWGYGSFAIIIPVICAPVAGILLYNRSKAEKQGLIQRKNRELSGFAAFKYYFIQFDIIGMLFLIAAFALLLLPLGLAASATGGWSNPSMIAMLVLGFVFFFVFAAWERYGAKVTFLPWYLLKDRTVLGGCLCGMTLFISFYCWDTYFLSYLQAVHDLSIKDAGYAYNTYNIGSCVFAVLIGFAIRGFGSFKYMAMIAIPVQILGTGLMIYFRQPGQGIGYVIMCQIFIAFSGGALVICEQMAVMAAASHQEVAVVLALLSLFTSIGGAVGQAISGAIWTNNMPAKLIEYLPPDSKDLATSIYASLTTQITYPVGTPIRDAIIHAYGDVQRLLTITGTAVLPAVIFFILMWRNIDVRTIKQTKGNVV